ncbi:MAG: CoA transferase, partial [Gammaproteobacteria bacterium]
MTNTYRCGDGKWLNLVSINEARQFGPLLEVLGCAEAADDPRFATLEARRANSAALVALLDARFALRPRADWSPLLDAAGVTFSEISTLDDIPNDPQLRAAGALVPFAEGPGLTVSSPFTMDGALKVGPNLAPTLGAHTLAVLRETGYDEAGIQALRERGIVGG